MDESRHSRPSAFSPFSSTVETDDDYMQEIEVIDEMGEANSLYEDSSKPKLREDILDGALVSPLCCWVSALVLFFIGILCVIVAGSVEATYQTDDEDEIADLTIILSSLGAIPALLCIATCAMGTCIFAHRRFGFRSSYHYNPEFDTELNIFKEHDIDDDIKVIEDEESLL